MIGRDDQGQIVEISEVFHEIMKCLHWLHSEQWAGVDLTMAQFKAMMLIASLGGLSGGELAQRLGVGPSSITPIIDKLVRHGYVYREEDTTDRRVCWARPTKAGIDFYEHMIASGRAGLEELLTLLTPVELAKLEGALNLLHRAALSRIEQTKKER